MLLFGYFFGVGPKVAQRGSKGGPGEPKVPKKVPKWSPKVPKREVFGGHFGAERGTLIPIRLTLRVPGVLTGGLGAGLDFMVF